MKFGTHLGSRMVLVLFLLVALAGGLTARAVVTDEEHRLLADRSAQIGSQLTNDLAGIESSLNALGAADDLSSRVDVFDTISSSMLKGPTRALALFSPKGDGFRLVASTGDGWIANGILSPQQVNLMRQAEASVQSGPEMVSAVVTSGYDSRLVFAIALSPSQGSDVVYEEDAIDPANPITGSSFTSGDVAVSLYASTRPDSAALVYSSEWPDSVSSGPVTHVAVGVQQWALVVHALHPLTGSFAPFVPWLLFGGGVITAVLAAAFVEALVRRRNFALELVEERTAELENSLQSLELVQAELRHAAFHDGLTNLPNRVLLTDRIDQALLRAKRPGSKVVLVFMDIDRFKWVNDSLGHAAGDHLLVSVAERIRSTLRPGDTVARIGGDEFVVVCEHSGSDEDAVAMAHRIVDRVAEPVDVNGNQLRVTLSAGVAIGDSNTTAQELLRHGDIAMYRAKDRGRDCIVLFRWEMHSAAASRLPAEASLRAAIESDEIRVHFQPLVVPATNQMIGFEALARWTDSEGVSHSPLHFIPTAEETGLIVPLGDSVLTQACRQVGEWNRAHAEHPPLSLSVNLSARQLEIPELTARVSEVLDQSGMSSADLWLEITETVLMEESGPTLATLDSLSDLGVTLVADDFGTGYSSLLYLHKMPIKVLKIDQSFVSGMGVRHTDDAIVASLITLAHDLGLVAVAEGVETETQAESLRTLGCDLAQGYFWSRPVPTNTVTAWLAGTDPRRASGFFRSPATVS